MEQKKVSQNRAKKEKIVAELSQKVSRSKGLVFTNYQGLTHVQLENIKKAVKAFNAELVVTKNTLLSRSLQNSKFLAKPDLASRDKSQISNLQGPTATLFLYGDAIEPLKALAKTIKELNLPTIKLGIIEGKDLTSEQVLKLAALPSREVLIAQVIFQMKAPIYGLHRALGWEIQKFVLTLKAVEETKAG